MPVLNFYATNVHSFKFMAIEITSHELDNYCKKQVYSNLISLMPHLVQLTLTTSSKPTCPEITNSQYVAVWCILVLRSRNNWLGWEQYGLDPECWPRQLQSTILLSESVIVIITNWNHSYYYICTGCPIQIWTKTWKSITLNMWQPHLWN